MKFKSLLAFTTAIALAGCGGVIDDLIADLDPCGSGDLTEDCGDVDNPWDGLGGNGGDGGNTTGQGIAADIPNGRATFTGQVNLVSVSGSTDIKNNERTVSVTTDYTGTGTLTVSVDVSNDALTVSGELEIDPDAVFNDSDITIRSFSVDSASINTGLEGTVSTTSGAVTIGNASFIHTAIDVSNNTVNGVSGDADENTADIYLDIGETDIGAMSYSATTEVVSN